MEIIKNILRRVIPHTVITSIETLKYGRLVRGPLTYNQDGLATRHNCDFMNDSHFIESYNRGKQTGSWGEFDIHYRAYIACWVANKVKNLEGDFIECGVNKGGLALTVMNYINFKFLPKNFYLLDTFCGLSDEYISKEERKHYIRAGGYDECYNDVLRTFSDFKNVEIIRGTVPDTLPSVQAKKVCFISIDMNCMEPEIAAAEFFWDKLISGGVIVLDDYGWSGHIIQKHAFDDFASRKGVQVLSLPTGQGLIFKP